MPILKRYFFYTASRISKGAQVDVVELDCYFCNLIKEVMKLQIK